LPTILSLSLLFLILAFGTSVPVSVAAAHFQTKTIHVGPSPDAVTVDSSRGLVYVAVAGDNSVSAINASTDLVVGNISVGSDPDAIGVNPSTGLVYVANANDYNVTVIQESSNHVVGSIPVGYFPDALGVNPGNSMVYVANQDSGTVSVINGITDSVTGNVTVGNGPDAVAVDPSTSRVYVANSFDNTLSVIDGSTNSVIATVPVGNDPSGVAVNSATELVYVANFLDSTISVINGSDDGVVATVNVTRAGPIAMVLDSITDVVYIANFNQSDISMMNGSSYAIVSSVTLGRPIAVAVNGPTNMVYVANYDEGSLSAVHGYQRPSQTYTVCSSPATIGVSVTCTALSLGVSPAGTVTWASSGAGSFASSNGSTCTLSHGFCSIEWKPEPPVPGAQVQITATYSGDTNNKGSSGEFKLLVNEAESATNVACTPSPVVVGSSAECIASVSGYAPTGEILWGTNGTVTFSSKTCTLSGGTCDITIVPQATSPLLSVNASYFGDPNNLRSWGEALVRISPSSPTITSATIGITAVAAAACTGAVLFAVRRHRMSNSVEIVRKD